MTQFSLFGAEAAEPALEDLDGLLLAGGQWVRGPGGARLSVVVADRWRADALAAAFAGLAVGSRQDEPVASAAGGWGVRTQFAEPLVARATSWTRGANHVVPAGFALSAGGLRLWAIGAGHRDDAGYVLATAPPAAAGADPVHTAAGGQLSRWGVAAVSLTHRGRPGWRVTSMRRVRRLVELVGPAPAGAGKDWPADPGTGLGAPARRVATPS